jgi:hypothetical protein
VNKMSFRQFQYSEGGKASKVAVIGAAVIGSGRANIHEHVDDIHDACCADVKRKYRQHALKHHSDKHGCPENFYKLTNAKEQALKTCNPCSHNRDKKHTRTKYRQRPTSSKKKAKKRRKATRRKEESKQKQKNQRNKDDHETKVSATSAAIVVGGLVLASGGPEKEKKEKKKTLRQTSTGRTGR